MTHDEGMSPFEGRSGLTLCVAVMALILTAGGPEELCAQSDALRTVKVTRPVRKDLERIVKLPGDVLPYQQAELSSRVTGYLDTVGVVEGARAAKESVLAKIDVPDLQAEYKMALAGVLTEKTQVTRAETALETARVMLGKRQAELRVCQAESSMKKQIVDRRRKLVKDRAITTEELEMAEAEVAVARARCDAAEASIALAGADVRSSEAMLEIARVKVDAAETGADRLKTLLGFAEIRAPYKETLVTRRHLDPGALVEVNGAPILTVMDVSKVRVLIRVPERDATLAKAGIAVVIRLDANPLHPILSTLTRTSGALDLATRTMRAEIELDNSDGKFLPGQYCDVELGLVKRIGVLLLPAGAIGTGAEGAFVWAVESGKARKLRVELGYDDGKEVEVSSGLRDDLDVVISGHSGLRDGESVSAEK